MKTELKIKKRNVLFAQFLISYYEEDVLCNNAISHPDNNT